MKPNCNNRTVFIGDNREVMLGLNADIADAIITDPPFNTGQMRKDDQVKIDKKKSKQTQLVDIHGNVVQAYKDSWKIGDISKRELEYIKYKDKDLVRFCQIIGNQHSAGMEAYLMMMASRLLLCHEILKETGSIFLHCDHSANGYLRMLMDAIFGKKNFRNEIVWCYYRARPGGNQFARLSETIFWYSKSDKWTFNKHLMQVPLTEEALKSNRIVRKDGSVWERKKAQKTCPIGGQIAPCRPQAKNVAGLESKNGQIKSH